MTVKRITVTIPCRDAVVLKKYAQLKHTSMSKTVASFVETYLKARKEIKK